MTINSNFKSLNDILYDDSFDDFRETSTSFRSWDRGDCSEMGAALLMFKCKYEDYNKDEYFEDCYSEYSKVYKYLSENISWW